MDNQHRKITGYRELTQTEIDLINAIKDAGTAIHALHERVLSHLHAQHRATDLRYEDSDNELVDGPLLDTSEQVAAKFAERARLEGASPYRWLAISRTDLQTGLMALTRAVAQPTSF